jgi:hypothetical protein
MTRALRFLAAGLLSMLVLVGAGCGGGGAKTSAAGESGAKLVRSDVLAFVAIDSDLGSSQWQALDDLAQKFPGRERVLTRIKQGLAQHNLDYDSDLKPALGPEVDVAVAAGADLGSSSVVLLTKPDDVDNFKQLVKRLNASSSSGHTAVYREVDGWYAVAESEAELNSVLKSGGGSLADDATFNDALDELPGDALVKAYVDGAQVAATVKEAARQGGHSFDPSSLGLDKLDFITASVSAENDGVRVRAASRGAGTKTLGPGDYSSKLLEDVPGDAIALLAFRGGISDQLKQLRSNPMFARQLQQLEAALGVTLDQALGLLSNEVALYVRPGLAIPEITLVLEPKDQAAALATIDKVATRLATLGGAKVTGGAVKTIDLGQFQIHYGGTGGKVVVTSGTNAIAELGSGSKLPDSADFKQAKDAAGLPDSNGGFLYLDLKDSIPLLETLAGLTGNAPSSEVTENLRPLRSFLAWAAGSGDTRTFDAFLEIK